MCDSEPKEFTGLEYDAISIAESMMRKKAIFTSLTALEQNPNAHLLGPDSLSDLVRRVAADKGYLRADSSDPDASGRGQGMTHAEITQEERINFRLSVRRDIESVLREMVDMHFERFFAGLTKAQVTERIPHIVATKQHGTGE